MFITKHGLSWAKESADNPVSKECRKLLDEAKLVRPGLSFYSLRHTTQTIGEEAFDLAAVKPIMGHSHDAKDMSASYRRKDDRRSARAWRPTSAIGSSPRKQASSEAAGK